MMQAMSGGRPAPLWATFGIVTLCEFTLRDRWFWALNQPDGLAVGMVTHSGSMTGRSTQSSKSQPCAGVDMYYNGGPVSVITRQLEVVLKTRQLIGGRSEASDSLPDSGEDFYVASSSISLFL
jgi:hypothetical protein